MLVQGISYRTVDWEDGAVVLIDQPMLPHVFRRVKLRDVESVARAITTMVVRGAGAIGATAAYGLALAARLASDQDFDVQIAQGRARLADTRPTAQNLFYGLDRVGSAIAQAGGGDQPGQARAAALIAAQAVADEDAAWCEAIGRHGAPLLEDGWGVATHCNAGWLAFVDWGSALSPVYAAARAGRSLHVFVDETRPRGQGARLTAWELAGEGIAHSVIADNAFAHYARAGAIQAVIVGSDRVARNGDVANKIGTCGRAIIARHVGIPFYVALPSSTIDADCPNGGAIPIEERDGDEVRWTWGETDGGEFSRVRTTYADCPVKNPAFDVTPADLVDGLITEHGVFPASSEGVRRILEAAGRL